VHTVTVTHLGAGGYRVSFPREGGTTTVPAEGSNEATPSAEAEVKPSEGPSPIAPELKELIWGGGSFLVFLVLMRVWLFPKVKKGMDARYGKIRADLESAESTKADAEREVADYQSALAAVRAEAAARVGKLIAERAVKAGITEVVFDRGGYIYHGRVKALADAAREGGLKF